MNKRGVSPVIATVLLIAIVVVIALIVFLWFRGFSQEAIMKFGKNIELVCDDVRFDASFDGSSFSISNEGNVPIYRMKIKIIGDGSHSTEDLAGFVGLSAGGVDEYTHNIGSAEEVVLIPVLRGKSEKGEVNHVCDENYGYSLFVS